MAELQVVRKINTADNTGTAMVPPRPPGSGDAPGTLGVCSACEADVSLVTWPCPALNLRCAPALFRPELGQISAYRIGLDEVEGLP